MDIDHENRDTLDNRRSNLRACSRSLNNANSRRRKDNTSGFKGVSYDAARNRWWASLCCDGKDVLRKRFRTREEAYEAYCRAAREYFGEYARVA